MDQIAYVFAGQGSQSKGMGAAFSNDPLFVQLGSHWSIPPSELFTETPYWEQHPLALQSMLATTSLVLASKVQEIITPSMVAGLSLGEYSALTFAGVFEPKDLWRILDQRSQWMLELSQEISSELVVVLGLDRNRVETIVASFQNVHIANHNAPDQIVIGGESKGMDAVTTALMQGGARRCVKLPVVVASHTPLMQPMVSKMETLLNQTTTHEFTVPVISNASALPHELHSWKPLLSQQLSTTVEWVQSIDYMVQKGVKTFIEIGPGNVLSGLIQKIYPQATIYSVNTIDDVLKLKAIKDQGGFQ
jgi:[acyl-carrier-protein] S-malonyltransferase